MSKDTSVGSVANYIFDTQNHVTTIWEYLGDLFYGSFDATINVHFLKVTTWWKVKWECHPPVRQDMCWYVSRNSS